jgi:hypothetical protein
MKMHNSHAKLKLDTLAQYKITVQGRLDTTWSDWNETVTVLPAEPQNDNTLTELMVTADQAALHGLLRRLYAFGLPLVSVQWIEAPKP